MSGGGERARVGFVGIGRMGMPMARNLLARGFPLTVFNRTTERAQQLVDEGATLAATPSELAAAADVVVTMLADGAAVREVLEGKDGILAGAATGTVLAEMSTIGPLAARELAGLCAASSVSMIDAPVSGSTAAAQTAQLVVMVGGEESAFERARPVLSAMSKTQFYLGPSGAGAALKLGLNVVVASIAHALSEALVLAEAAGIERVDAYEVIAESAIASPFVAYKREAFIKPDDTPVSFALDLMAKDLSLALDAGERAGVPLLAAGAAAQAVALASGLEGGDEDLVRIADALRRVRGGDGN